ncbi:uncharacterized protein SEPMUDRAFT_54994 [Sphaerulina musiva SO2202]|uniref:Uncharacterized protein n=1 Tax=Sphaerulina musiva (strain SO2202) TaxID=692275 RepID=M3C832_SPHMS|nr:uncharacterized protein SEPMUDRAFT_54994 [Sphaerulina musiva SO2202]EMF08050.1 hypothetical protein SEPMUDRAFT_54994 [Sphaerulina musiva SO2202]
MSSRILPPALEPYLQLPPETSLILLTSTLGCSVNWLTARFISSALASDQQQQQPPLAILLVSWIRDLAFWKNELRRTSGIDISKLSQTNKFAFVDYLNNSSTPSSPSTSPPPSPPNLSTSHPLIHQSLTDLLSSSTPPKILLILDAPDILLTTTPSSPTPSSLPTLLLTLRSHPSIHSTLLSTSADLPLISNATQNPQNSHTAAPTSLEISSAAFISTQAHLSRWVMGVRALETGAARDVSGVLRITRGGGWEWEEDGEGEGEGMGREVELLYLVGRDGNVKVFERGVDG